MCLLDNARKRRASASKNKGNEYLTGKREREKKDMDRGEIERTAQAVHEFEGEVLGEEEPGGQLGGGPVEKYGRVGDQDHTACVL